LAKSAAVCLTLPGGAVIFADVSLLCDEERRSGVQVAVQESEKIWLDGKLVPWKDAQVHVLTYSLHYGLAAFEGIRCYKGERSSAIFRLNEHVDGLFASCHITLMTIPFWNKEMAD